MDIKTSICIVTYNSRNYIGECLRSIDKNVKFPYEIIVVDNDSSDKTVEVVKKCGVSVNLITSPENLGFSRANNLAVEKAEGEYLFFLNPDTVILDGKVDELFDFLDNHPDVAVTAPKLIDESGNIQPSVQKLPTLGGALAEYFLGVKNAYGHYVPGAEKPLEVESVVGGAMVISKEKYKEVGGFDNRYFMYFEDLDLCRKVRNKGWKIVYMPEVVVKHKIGGSAATNPKVKKYIEKSFVLYHGPVMATLLNFIHQIVRIRNFLLRRLSFS